MADRYYYTHPDGTGGYSTVCRQDDVRSNALDVTPMIGLALASGEADDVTSSRRWTREDVNDLVFAALDGRPYGLPGLQLAAYVFAARWA